MVEVYPYLGRVIDLRRVYRGYMSKSLYCINPFSIIWNQNDGFAQIMVTQY